AEVIPTLFPREPKFAGSEYALRLYGNLFGVWDLLLAGRSPEELSRARAPTAAPAEEGLAPEGGGPMEHRLPARGSIPGDVVPFAGVERPCLMLQSLPERELGRLHDRDVTRQAWLAGWAGRVEGRSGSGRESLDYLCFGRVPMFVQGWGERI